MSPAAKVTGLWIYPVKSCRGISLNEMQIGATGPINDRRWMIVDEQNNFLTLRTVSKLAEIKTALQGPFLHLYAGNNKILVDTTQECAITEKVTVWADTFKAGVESHDINEALSDFLSKSVKLVRYQKESFLHKPQRPYRPAKACVRCVAGNQPESPYNYRQFPTRHF